MHQYSYGRMLVIILLRLGNYVHRAALQPFTHHEIDLCTFFSNNMLAIESMAF
jgi:hypothetical protein